MRHRSPLVFTHSTNNDFSASYTIDEEKTFMVQNGIIVISDYTEIGGYRKLSDLSLNVSYEKPEHSEKYSIQFCLLPHQTTFDKALPLSANGNVMYPVPNDTLYVCSLDDAINNRIEVKGPFDIPPGYFLCAIIWYTDYHNSSPISATLENNTVYISGNFRLSF